MITIKLTQKNSTQSESEDCLLSLYDRLYVMVTVKLHLQVVSLKFDLQEIPLAFCWHSHYFQPPIQQQQKFR